MSREKIEEMALELCRPRNIVKMIHHRTCGNCDTSSCDIYELCVDLYNAGYRKQSEWISVEERLPTIEEEERGLVGIVNGHNGKIRFTDAIIFVNYDFDEKEWWSQDYDLTNCKVEYWMPLPEPPKMKGGAE